MVEGLHWLGHSSFRWDGSKIIYFDPWKLPGAPAKADIIFISHEHFDHFSKNDIMLVASKDTVVICPKEVEGQAGSLRRSVKEIRPVAPGDDSELSGVKIKAVPSYNTNKNFHTKASKKVGYIVTMDGVSVYHAGDTDNIPEMKDYRCDVALLPVGGTYVMTAGEAAQAALAVKPKMAIPMHYGEVAGSAADAIEFRDLLKGKIEVKILKKEG